MCALVYVLLCFAFHVFLRDNKTDLTVQTHATHSGERKRIFLFNKTVHLCIPSMMLSETLILLSVGSSCVLCHCVSLSPGQISNTAVLISYLHTET